MNTRIAVLLTAIIGLFQASVASAEKVGELVAIHVIPRPHGNVDVTLPLGRQDA